MKFKNRIQLTTDDVKGVLRGYDDAFVVDIDLKYVLVIVHAVAWFATLMAAFERIGGSRELALHASLAVCDFGENFDIVTLLWDYGLLWDIVALIIN